VRTITDQPLATGTCAPGAFHPGLCACSTAVSVPASIPPSGLGKVPRNVATLVDLPAKGHRELRCFTPAEAQRFLAAVEAEQQAHLAADSDQACFAAFFIVLLLTGVRPDGRGIGAPLV
jgi:hypothetical protein